VCLLNILTSVGDQCPFQVVICDTEKPDNPIIYANVHFCKEFEVSPSEVIGMSFMLVRGSLTSNQLRLRKPFYKDIVNYRLLSQSSFLNRIIVLPFNDRLSLGIQITLYKPKGFPHSSKTIGDKIFNALHLITLAKELGDEGKDMIRKKIAFIREFVYAE